MKSILVKIKDRSYNIFVGYKILNQLGNTLKKNSKLANRQAIIVTQDEVFSHHGKVVIDSLHQAGFSTTLFKTPPSKSSEKAKSQDVYLKLIQKIAETDGKNKSLFLMALGGGVIGDLTGFAASVYRRGIPYVQVPTTLTAQVDSSIGGKTGIDIPQGKNLLGTIYQPHLIFSDIATLETLPSRQWSDGFAEVIKYGIIESPSLFEKLERLGLASLQNNFKELEKIIYQSASIKSGVVQKDEFDKKDIRIVLNFGHTAGHGIEASSGYLGQYTHGEAVGLGMLVAFDISLKMGILKDVALIQRLEKTLIKFNLPLFFKGLSTERIMQAIGYDKKSENGKNRFVLPIRLGKVIVVSDIQKDIIEHALEKRRA